MARWSALALLVGLVLPGWARAEVLLDPATFPEGWTQTAFVGETRYRVDPGAQMIEVTAKGSASGWCRDLVPSRPARGVLRFSWRLDQFPDGDDGRTKAGDDFALRLYLVQQRGIMGIGSWGVMYVWAKDRRYDETWVSPYAPSLSTISAVAPGAEAGTEVTIERDLADDLQRVGKAGMDRIDTVCIMTDADSSKSVAVGAYGRVDLR